MAHHLVDGLRRWIATTQAKLAAMGILSPWSITSRLMLAFVGPGRWSIDEYRARNRSEVWGYAAPGGERPGLDDE